MPEIQLLLPIRKARRRLGTRSVRRANTNGKSFGVTTGGRAVKRKYPKPVARKTMLAVRKLHGLS